MKRTKQTVATVMAMTMAVSAFSVVVSADEVKDAVNAAQQSVSTTKPTVDLASITRKNTTIDVTIPDYQLRTTGLQYTWRGPLTIESGKTAVISLDTDIGELSGATVTIVGVDGQTFTKTFTTDPEDENYNKKLFDGKKIILDLAEIGKPSSIQSVYTNPREGEDTDVLFGEDVLTTPAITSITVAPLYGYDQVEPYTKKEIDEYNNKVKGTKASITYTHPYFVKQVTEDGTQYNEITVNGVPGKEYDGYQAYLKDEAKFKKEATNPVTDTKNVLAGVPAELMGPDGEYPSAEDVWNYFSKQVGESTDAVDPKWTPATLNVFTGLTDADFEKTSAAKYEKSSTVVDTTNLGKVYNALPGLQAKDGNTDGAGTLVADAFGSSTAKRVDFTLAYKGTVASGKTDVELYLILTDKASGAQAAYATDAAFTDVGSANGPINLKPVAVGTDLKSKLNGADVKTTTNKGNNDLPLTKDTHYTPAGLAAVTTGNAWATGQITTYTGAGYDQLKSTVPASVAKKVPAGIDFNESINTSLIQQINKQVGNRVDSDASLILNTTVQLDKNKVAFTALFNQVGTGTAPNKQVSLQTKAIDIDNIPDELELTNGAVAIKLKVTDKEALKKALVTERNGEKYTAWTNDMTNTANYADIGSYTPSIAATEPKTETVIEKMTKAGLTKPTKSAWKFKTAEKKPQDLNVNAYTKGESAFTSKADFLATYPNVVDAIKKMNTGLTAWGIPADGSTYPGGHEPCTGKKYLTIENGREFDPAAPSAPGSATSNLVKKNRVFGTYNEAESRWESAWTNITSWADYYVDAYNSSNTTSYYAPGVLAEMNDIIGSNKGAVISIHLDPEGFEDFDDRSVDSKRWFAMNNSCVLRVNGVSSGQYANLVSYDSTASTFSFNWDDIAKDRYSDTSVLVRALEILTSEKAECDTITISIPDQKAWLEATNPTTEVKPDTPVVQPSDKDKDTIVEIKDGDKTDSDNQDIAPPDDSNTPPASTTVADPKPIPDDVTTTEKKEDVPPVTSKDVVEVTVPSNTGTPTTGEPIALGVIPLAIAGIFAAIKKKMS